MDDAVKKVEQDLKEAGIEIPGETPEVVTESQNTRQLTEFELEQQSKGWNPDGPKSAKEWANNEPLYEEIKNRGKEIKQLRRTLDNLKAMMDKQEQAAYNRAMADLSAAKTQAVQRGDVAQVQQIEQQANELQKQQPMVEPEAVREFKERNADWFEGNSVEDIKMQAFARYHDSLLIAKQLTPEQHIQALEEEMHKAFPNYFKTSQDSNVQSVEGGSSAVAGEGKRKKFTFDSLSPTQKKTAKEFARLGVMPVEKYIDELVKMGDLK